VTEAGVFPACGDQIGSAWFERNSEEKDINSNETDYAERQWKWPL